MNPEFVKERIKNSIGNNIIVTVYGMRNKVDKYEGIIYKIYPNFFTILYRGEEKSFNFRDIITKDIKISYLN